MSGREASKQRLLNTADIFMKATDEEHPINASEICAELEARGIPSERKAVYRDIEALREFGWDIISSENRSGYFLASRTFELAELSLLGDAVQAAGFISGKKTKELIGKIGTLASVHQAETMKSRVYIDSRNKSANEAIYYIIDMLARAISEEKKVRFNYSRHRIVSSGLAKSESREFTVSPYALIWSDDKYYLVCNYEKYDNLMHLRVDRMTSPELLDERARHFSEVSGYKTAFNSADYVNSIFNMYSGEPKSVELKCENSLLDVMLDRFGERIKIRYADDEHFSFVVTAVLSDGFIGWLMQFGDRAEVIRPVSLRAEIASKAAAMSRMYNK